jgi:hypothetical protein
MDDYVLKVKNHIGTDAYTEDLLLTTGQNLLNLITQVHGMNPVLVRQDLAKAQVANKNNLSVVEQVFRDNFVSQMVQLNMTAKGIQPTDGKLNLDAYNRLYKDVMSGQAFRDNPGTMTWASLVAAIFPPYLFYKRYNLRPDLYQFRFNSVQNLRPAGDTSHGDFAYFRDMICIQTLAFENRKFYQDFCTTLDPKTGKRTGIVLQSPSVPDDSRNSYLNVSWDKYTEGGLIDRPVRDDSICAFRDFNRRNLADWLTQNLKAIPKPEGLVNSSKMSP